MFLRCLLAFIWLSAFISADTPTYISLRGYLGKAEIEKASDALTKSTQKNVAIEINSSGGDLLAVLDLSKQLYEKKSAGTIEHLTVYINDQAVGPPALIPFLADELLISPSVAWGDVFFGSEGVLPVNLLKSRLESFISPVSKNAALLKILATAMIDKNALIVKEGNVLKIADSSSSASLQVVSGRGETLVLNQNQLQELKLVNGVLSVEAFRNQIGLSEVKQSEIEKLGSRSDTLAISPADFESELKAHIKWKSEGSNTIGRILIGDHEQEINQATWLLVKNALDYYKINRPAFIILELNTPGGEVFAAQKISDALKDFDTQQGIPVVAYVNNWAISAGAMLAYSCRFIVVVKDASIGAAEPVTISGGELKEVSEKINSALRADFANRASFYGRNPLIAEAMVDKSLLLVKRHGKIIKLNDEKEVITTGPTPDIVISGKGKLLTLSAEEAIAYGVADLLLLPKKVTAISEQEQKSGKWPFGSELLAKSPFFSEIPHAEVDAYLPDWKTEFFILLASPLVSSALFLGFILGLYIEMNTPGFGIAGSIAVSCLILMILSSFSLEIANWLEVILLLLGALIIAVELTVLPTFGLLGFFGIALFLIGLFGMLLPGAGSVQYEFDTQTLNAAGEAFFEKLGWYAGTLAIGSILIAFLATKISPKWGALRRFVLSGNEQEGYYANESKADFPKVGTIGEVMSTLRPAGKVVLNTQIYDAISTTGFIEKGTRIVVTGSDTGNLVVAEYFDESTLSES